MQENHYGSHTGSRNDEHNGSKPKLSVSPFPASASESDPKVIDLKARFAPSQREIDLYYFYFSSRL